MHSFDMANKLKSLKEFRNIETLFDKYDLFVMGSFPLHLIAPYEVDYNDLDFYTTSWNDYYGCILTMSPFTVKRECTKNTIRLHLNDDSVFQIVKPFYPHWLNGQTTVRNHFLNNVDLSVSACSLYRKDNCWFVDALYWEDIVKRQCRIFITGEWTNYRVQSYEAKGFHCMIAPKDLTIS